MQEFQDQALAILSGFYIHAIVLWILLIGSAIGSAVFYLCEKPLRGTLLAVVPLGLLVWFIVAVSQPATVARSDFYEIKTVTWPDGTSCQMWTTDGVHHNVTTQFGKTVDPDKWHVERVRWNTMYCNISFTACGPKMQEPTFFLTEKKR